jgi:hypothetical protein
MDALVFVLVDSLKPVNDVRQLRKRSPPAACGRRERPKLNDVLWLKDRSEKVYALV